MLNYETSLSRQYDLRLEECVSDSACTFDDLDSSDKEALTTYLFQMERRPMALFIDSLGGAGILEIVMTYLKSYGTSENWDCEEFKMDLYDEVMGCQEMLQEYYRDVINEDLSATLENYLDGLNDSQNDIGYLTSIDNRDRALAAQG